MFARSINTTANDVKPNYSYVKECAEKAGVAGPEMAKFIIPKLKEQQAESIYAACKSTFSLELELPLHGDEDTQIVVDSEEATVAHENFAACIVAAFFQAIDTNAGVLDPQLLKNIKAFLKKSKCILICLALAIFGA